MEKFLKGLKNSPVHLSQEPGFEEISWQFKNNSHGTDLSFGFLLPA